MAYDPTASWVPVAQYMMTSSNGNIFRVNAHLCAEFIGPWWIPRTKASGAELWVNNREAVDLRRYRTHYDVIVMNHLLFSNWAH